MFCGGTGKRRKAPRRRRSFLGTYLSVEYKGGLDGAKDKAIRKALGKYENGSGFSFIDGSRDHSAIVPDDAFDGVIAALKKIRGIRTKKLVKKWVLVR